MFFGRDSKILLDCSISYSQQGLRSVIQHRLLAQLPCIWDECSEVALFHSLAQLLPGSNPGGSEYLFLQGNGLQHFFFLSKWGYSKWCIPNGVFQMVYSKWCIPNGVFQMVYSKWCIRNGVF